MKIFIDSTWFIIYKWENGKMGDMILSADTRYPDSFQEIIDQILTPSQLKKYITGDTDIVYNLSKKKTLILFNQQNRL